MAAHKHAKLMAAYAADALETDRPWERWQVKYSRWYGADPEEMHFHKSRRYRRKPDAPPVPWHLLREAIDNE